LKQSWLNFSLAFSLAIRSADLGGAVITTPWLPRSMITMPVAMALPRRSSSRLCFSERATSLGLTAISAKDTLASGAAAVGRVVHDLPRAGNSSFIGAGAFFSARLGLRGDSSESSISRANLPRVGAARLLGLDAASWT